MKKIIIILSLFCFVNSAFAELSFYTINKNTQELILLSDKDKYEVIMKLDFVNKGAISLEFNPIDNSLFALISNGDLYKISLDNFNYNLISTIKSNSVDINGSWRGISINNRNDIYIFNEESGSAQGRLFKIINLGNGTVEPSSGFKSGSASILGIEFDESNKLWTVEQCCNHTLKVFSGFTGQVINLFKTPVTVQYPEDLAYFEFEDMMIGIDTKNEYTADMTDFFYINRENGTTEVFRSLDGNFTGVAEKSSALSIEKERFIIDLSIYPNPTTNKFTIQSDNILDYVRVYTSTGYILFEEKVFNQKIDFDLSEFSSGVYFIEIEYKGNKILKKIIKN